MEKKPERNLIKNFFYLLILKGSNYIIPLISVPFLFKTLGVEKFGLVNFAFAFIQYFVILTDFGYNLYATRLIAENANDKKKVEEIFNNVMFSRILLLIAGLIILTILVMLYPGFSEDKSLYFLTYGFVIGNVLFPVWFFQGMEKMKFITMLSIPLKFFAIVPLFFIVKSHSDYLYVPFFNTCSSILFGIISLYIIKKQFGISLIKVKFSNILLSLKESSSYFLSRVSVSLYTSSNAFFLGIFSSFESVGYYSLAEKVFSAIQNAYSPLNSAIYPFMAKTKNIQLFKKLLFGVVGVNILCITGFYFYASEIFQLIFQNQATESVEIFKILLIACLIIVPSVLIGYPLLGVFGYGKFTNKTVIFPSIIHIIMLSILVFTNNINVFSVATTIILTEFLVFTGRLWGVFYFGILFGKKVQLIENTI